MRLDGGITGWFVASGGESGELTSRPLFVSLPAVGCLVGGNDGGGDEGMATEATDDLSVVAWRTRVVSVGEGRDMITSVPAGTWIADGSPADVEWTGNPKGVAVSFVALRRRHHLSSN